MKRIRCAGVLALLVGGLAVAAGQGADVPTWQVGDWWDAERSFNLDFRTSEPLELVVSLTIKENYRLTVAEIADHTTTGAGVTRAYRRTRSEGQLSGSGTATIAGISLPLNLRWNDGVTSGEDWTAVGDLSNLQERFELTGMLQAQILFLWLEVAGVSMDLTFDFRPPRELADFPIRTVGEEWSTTFTQSIRGHIQVQWNENFPLWPGGSPPDDLDEQIDVEVSQGVTFRYEGREARGGFPATYHIDAGPAMSLWYEPSMEEFVELALGDLDFGGGSGLTGFVVKILDSNLLPDPNLQILDIVPQPVTRGQSVQLVGSTDPATTVTATMLGQGSSDQVVTDGSGQFELWLLAPDHDDFTPANDDAGSFGVEVMAERVGRRVVTVQLALPPTRARSSWLLYR